MASIRRRGGSFAVLFREGGRQTSRTFLDLESAERFRELVGLGAERALAQMELEGREDIFTVDDLFESWITYKTGEVTDRTLREYRRDYTNWIQPVFGWRVANTLDEIDVQRWVDSMNGRLDAKSIADRHVVLSGMFRYGSARTRQLVDRNPCTETQLPKRRKKPPKGATIEEWQALYEAAQILNPDAADLLLFLVLTGWRFSEATALIGSSVETWTDRDGREVTYASVTQVYRRDGENRQVLVEDAKTELSLARRVKLPPTCAAMVERRMIGRDRRALVFTNPAGNRWVQSNFLYRTWPAIIKASGIERPITPHWLRHTHVFLLIRAGASLVEISRRLGHSNIQTTANIYGRMIDDISTESVERIDELLSTQTVPGRIVREVRGELGSIDED